MSSALNLTFPVKVSFQWPFCSLCRRYRRAERSTSEEVDPITFHDCMLHILKIIDTPVSASNGREQKVKELKLTHWEKKTKTKVTPKLLK